MGVTHPAYYDNTKRRWLRTFGGGFLATCGLTTAGAAASDEGEALGMHGRIGNTPGERVSYRGYWKGDDYYLECRGIVRETEVFAANLTLERRIAMKLGEPAFWVEDKVTNAGYQTTPLMLLYHINLGFPLIGPDTRLVTPAQKILPRDDIAAPGIDTYAEFTPPIPGYQEQVFYHEMNPSDGPVTVKVINLSLNGWSGMALHYNTAQLPKFTQWKMTAQGEYVLGLEPANCWVEGRAKERERGTLQFLEPGESRCYHLKVEILP